MYGLQLLIEKIRKWNEFDFQNICINKFELKN